MSRDLGELWRRLVFSVLGLALIGAGACRSENVSAPALRAYVIFVDLSLSLNDTQKDGLPRTLEALVSGMPAGSRVVVFPIAEKVVASGPLYRTSLPRARNATERKNLRIVKRALTKKILSQVQAMQETLKKGRALQFTCVSDALRQAAKEARDLRSVTEPVLDEIEIVFLSDMLEDCNASLLKRPVDLEKPMIEDELKLAREIPAGESLLDLEGARVTIVLPPIALAPPTTQRPLEHDLEAFWRAVLDHCNDDSGAFRFAATLPERLRSAG